MQQRCEVCDDTNATTHCQECRRSTCEECDEILHLVDANKSHRRIPLYPSGGSAIGSHRGSYANTRTHSPRGVRSEPLYEMEPSVPSASMSGGGGGLEGGGGGRMGASDTLPSSASYGGGSSSSQGMNMGRRQQQPPIVSASADYMRHQQGQGQHQERQHQHQERQNQHQHQHHQYQERQNAAPPPPGQQSRSYSQSGQTYPSYQQQQQQQQQRMQGQGMSQQGYTSNTPSRPVSRPISRPMSQAVSGATTPTRTSNSRYSVSRWPPHQGMPPPPAGQAYGMAPSGSRTPVQNFSSDTRGIDAQQQHYAYVQHMQTLQQHQAVEAHQRYTASQSHVTMPGSSGYATPQHGRSINQAGPPGGYSITLASMPASARASPPMHPLPAPTVPIMTPVGSGQTVRYLFEPQHQQQQPQMVRSSLPQGYPGMNNMSSRPPQAPQPQTFSYASTPQRGVASSGYAPGGMTHYTHASGSQTPQHVQRAPVRYMAHNSMPQSMPRTPHNESAQAYKVQDRSPYTSHQPPRPMESQQQQQQQSASSSSAYNLDHAELRVRNLIADTERMLAGLNGPSKPPDGLSL